jgi:putative intracellular protease/amidase
MKKKTVLIFVFDGYADWEVALAMTGIRQSNSYLIKTIALDKAAIVSMAGLRIIPDLDFFPHSDLNDIDRDNTAMIILPGGLMWTNIKNSKIEIELLVQHCIDLDIPIAAIGDATIFLASQGILNNIPHTSNDKEKLRCSALSYIGEELYRDLCCVEFHSVVTAGSGGHVEFAQTVFEVLNIDCSDYLRTLPYFENTVLKRCYE